MKRALDVTVASLLLVTLLPLMALVAAVTLVTLGAPVILVQQRPGYRARLFNMFKFRTMRIAKDEHGQDLPDAERLGSIGRWIRASSLDELPELWNVLKGDMSLVGPRPLLVEYLPLYTPEQARRHEVRPGITGWAQINGRNAISWQDKFELDAWYVDHRSFLLDLRIIGATLWRVIRREGITPSGAMSTPKFTGLDGTDGTDGTDAK